MKMNLPLTQGRQATILSCYAPTLGDTDETKDSFYDLLDAEVQRVPSSGKLILLGDEWERTMVPGRESLALMG